MTKESEYLGLLDYPLDSKKILRKKHKIRRKLLDKNNFVNKKIAILGGTSTNEIKEQLELFLLKSGICPQFSSAILANTMKLLSSRIQSYINLILILFIYIYPLKIFNLLMIKIVKVLFVLRRNIKN